MKRRTFLQRGALSVAGTVVPESLATITDGSSVPANARRANDGTSTASAAGLTPYIPSAGKPWDERRAAHLLRRIGFGVTWEQIDMALKSTPQAIVQAMLQTAASPTPPGTWVTQNPFPQLTNDARTQYNTWARDLQEWWFNQMLQPATMLREKMVLFWHNHFVSEYLTVNVTQYMYNQNKLFRDNAFGDFRELTKKVTVDPAMLIYLDGTDNKAGNPNENYARELLELFTIGTGTYSDGTDHYTEHDVIELSRALTGWTVNGLSSEFRPARFDNKQKTIFGERANFGVNGQGERDVVDLIFEQVDPDANERRAAVFICSKLYTCFMHGAPDMEIVTAMARTLVSNNWRIGVVLQELLTSEQFFDDNIAGATIKSPVEFVVGSMRELKLKPKMNRTNQNAARPEMHDPITAMTYLSQILLNPPNVKGWPGGRDWISSATVPLRIRYSKMWVDPVPNSLAYEFDPVAFVKGFPDIDDIDKLLDHMIVALLPLGVSASTRATLLEEILAGAPVYEWDPDAPNSGTRIRACLIRMMNLAEYQLM